MNELNKIENKSTFKVKLRFVTEMNVNANANECLCELVYKSIEK